jgi:hypothetical protein
MTKREYEQLMNNVERSKPFKYIVNIIFWLSIFVSGFFISIDYKITLYIIGVWIALIICVYWPLFLKKGILDAFREFGNIIDDPIDNIKHKIHGMKIFGYTIRLPHWLMRNQEDPE